MTGKAKKVGTAGGTKRVMGLGEVLRESERIKDTVVQCSDDVSQVNAVLDNELEVRDPRSDIGTALQKSKSVEINLHDVSEGMSVVHTVLKKEVEERQVLEQKLVDVAEKERMATHAALHDPLTGLPNRMLFNERLEHGLEQAKRHGWKLAVMFLDLDGFKEVNDTYGHDAGDRLLQTLAQRLRESTRADDTVCRIGGDEFLYLLTEAGGQREVALLAAKLRKLMAAPCAIGGHDVAVKASIGIAIFPKDGKTAEGLVKRADTAMYHAKQTGSGYSLAP